jgi:oligo-1,6-glucosidase
MPTWDLQRFKVIQKRWYEGLWRKGWNSHFLNNHDHTRLVTRYGNDSEYRVQSAKMFAAMLHSLPGMPYIYQGEEIGMTGVRFNSIDDYNDIAMKNKFNELVQDGQDSVEILKILQPLSRDNSRTPVQWNDSENAGFTTGKPWIKINPNYKEINVEKALLDEDSVFYFYKKLIDLRKCHPVFVYGDYKPVLEEREQLYAYLRTYQNESLFFIANFSENNEIVKIPQEINISKAELLISNYKEYQNLNEITLKAYETRIYLIKNKFDCQP